MTKGKGWSLFWQQLASLGDFGKTRSAREADNKDYVPLDMRMPPILWPIQAKKLISLQEHRLTLDELEWLDTNQKRVKIKLNQEKVPKIYTKNKK